DACGSKADGASEGGGSRGAFDAEKLRLIAAAVRRAGRSPGVDGLIEGDDGSGHGASVDVLDAEHDLRRIGGDGHVLRDAGESFESGVLRASAQYREADALRGAVEAGLHAGLLAFGERADIPRIGGGAAC